MLTWALLWFKIQMYKVCNKEIDLGYLLIIAMCLDTAMIIAIANAVGKL